MLHYDHQRSDYLTTPRELEVFKDHDRIEIEGNSLFIFGEENCLRKKIGAVANSKIFGNFIIILIAVSTVTLSLDNPLEDPKGNMI